jgi:hypothetical protein
MEFPKLNAAELAAELEGLDLGDARLNERARAVFRALAESPSASFAKACDTEKEREGLYRFLRNDNVNWQALLAPHVQSTAQRASACSAVLALHDTTTVSLAADSDVNSFISTGKKGMLAHACLLTNGERTRFPLGVAGLEIIERAKPGKTKTAKGRAKSGSETAKLKDKEFDRWARLVDNVEQNLQHANVIHVMDREADCFALFAALAPERQFVVRFCKNRSARAIAPGSEWALVRDVLEGAKSFKRPREVFVGKRSKKTAPGANKAHPPRDSRTALLELSYAPIIIKAPRYVDGPDELRLTAVRVCERDTPAGETPIEWVLLTNLDVTTKAGAERIVDIYRERWLIEEFFKALKTGCNYRKRHLTNRHSIYNTLAAFLPIAWRALLLRELASQTHGSITDVFPPAEIDVLRAYSARIGDPLPTAATIGQALFFIASLGGHRKHRGPPGWLTLMKGLERFESMVEGWLLARAGM